VIALAAFVRLLIALVAFVEGRFEQDRIAFVIAGKLGLVGTVAVGIGIVVDEDDKLCMRRGEFECKMTSVVGFVGIVEVLIGAAFALEEVV